MARYNRDKKGRFASKGGGGGGEPSIAGLMAKGKSSIKPTYMLPGTEKGILPARNEARSGIRKFRKKK